MTMDYWKSCCYSYLLSYEHFYLPNLPFKMGLKPVCTAIFGIPLRANGDRDVTESYLE